MYVFYKLRANNFLTKDQDPDTYCTFFSTHRFRRTARLQGHVRLNNTTDVGSCRDPQMYFTIECSKSCSSCRSTSTLFLSRRRSTTPCRTSYMTAITFATFMRSCNLESSDSWSANFHGTPLPRSGASTIRTSQLGRLSYKTFWSTLCLHHCSEPYSHHCSEPITIPRLPMLPLGDGVCKGS